MQPLEGKLIIDSSNGIGRIDDRIYGGFVEHMGRCVYGGIYEPDHPLANGSGFRSDVLSYVRQLQIPLIRYPGGNFVSGFRWEDSVGPPEDRPVRIDLAWKSIEPNRVGLHEFTKWADEAESRVMMAVNLGTRGAAEAADLLEYCNVPGGTHLSELRKSHGQHEPYHYKVWCLGNEMDGPWQICNKTAAEYGLLARETGKAMKRLDPSIELVACGSSGSYLPTYPEWDATVLDLAYAHTDYLSVHAYINDKNSDLPNYLAQSLQFEAYIQSLVSVCDYIKAKHRSRKTMYLYVDEWNVEPFNWLNNDGVDQPVVGPALCEGNFSLADAVVFGTMIIALLKKSDRVKIACLAQLVNVFGPIMTEKRGIAWRQTTYYPFLHASLYGRGTAVHVHVSSPKVDTTDFTDVPLVESVAVAHDDGGLTVFAVNRSVDRALELELDLRGYAPFTSLRRIELTGPQPDTYNAASSPDAVIPRQQTTSLQSDLPPTVRLAPLSWNVIRFT